MQVVGVKADKKCLADIKIYIKLVVKIVMLAKKKGWKIVMNFVKIEQWGS